MRSFLLTLTLFAFCFAPQACAQERTVQDRLDEVQEMIDEEESTITVLEGQLKDALDENDTDRVEQLRSEIDAAYENLEEMKSLKGQLQELKDSAAEASPARPIAGGGGGMRGRGRRKTIPNPSLGGSEGNSINWEAERERRKIEKERERKRRATGPSFGSGGTAADGGGRARGTRRSNDSQRLRKLRDAFDALVDAGESELAEDVQDLIDAEERKRDRETRSRDRDRDRDRGERSGKGGIRRGGDGPAAADGPSRPARPRNRSGGKRRSDNKDDIEDLEDEIDRLREKLDEIKDRKDDDGQE